MKIVMSARGSRGDVMPIVAVGERLQRQGHQVTVGVPALFEQAVRQRGLRPALYPEDARQMMNGFGSGWSGLKRTLDWFARTIDEQHDLLVRESEGADLLVTGTNEMGAPCVAEYRGIPHYRITFGPMMVGYQDHPLLPWQGLPGVVNRAAWELNNGGVELMARGPINRNRAALGLKPLRGIGEYVARFGHTLFAMNTTLAPPCQSWGRTYDFTYTGYCHEPAEGELPPELEQFLASGERPVYIGFGSVSLKDPASFTRLVLDAVVLSGQRVVLGAGWTGLGQGAVAKNVFVAGETPHGVLFPRMAAVLHHGGSGTTHTVARAGVPQLVMPQFADQFYWGRRVQALGLGPAPVAPGRMTSRRLARALRELVQEPRHARHAAALGHVMRDEDGVGSIVAVLEAREGNGRAPANDRGRLRAAANS